MLSDAIFFFCMPLCIVIVYWELLVLNTKLEELVELQKVIVAIASDQIRLIKCMADNIVFEAKTKLPDKQ